jgi:hypothetical protein
MIARHWRGWTEPQNADAYEALPTGKVLSDLRRIQGYRGGYVLRSDGPVESEFIVINLFDSLGVDQKLRRRQLPDASV